ncbi:hypothetical protein [Priestia koreensis]|uniref:mediterrocin family bacteriocin n=1 Tax=Priestia koreensis TaxID=284581 RepID=UPI00203E0042|nr:hypothetical protein [Priestia koreensis]MCM3006845.1 hypothetical protein [Priestia koreensis]
MKKIFVNSALALGVLGSTLTFAQTDAQAGTLWRTNSYSFGDDWTDAAKGADWTLTYGYDTSWINEDYSHTISPTLKTQAFVENANGTFSSGVASKNSTAAIEVRHSGSSVRYGITVFR